MTKRPGSGRGVRFGTVVGGFLGRGFGHVSGLWPLLALDDFEFDAVALGERLEARALDRAEMHEDVRPSFPRDEAVPLCVVEPLHGACQAWHCTFPFQRTG